MMKTSVWSAAFLLPLVLISCDRTSLVSSEATPVSVVARFQEGTTVPSVDRLQVKLTATGQADSVQNVAYSKGTVLTLGTVPSNAAFSVTMEGYDLLSSKRIDRWRGNGSGTAGSEGTQIVNMTTDSGPSVPAASVTASGTTVPATLALAIGMWYTTDGSDPRTSTAAQPATGALEISQAETVKAAALKVTSLGDSLWSNVSSWAFAAPAISTDTSLKALDVVTGMLTPNFAAGMTSYHDTVPATATSETIFATATASNATVSDTGMVDLSGVASGDSLAKAITVSNGGKSLEYKVLIVKRGLVAAPTFSTDTSATYTSAQTVNLSSATSDATIYYTTDGSIPTTGSMKYSTALTVSSTETINAIAAKNGMTTSSVATATYKISIPGVVSAPTFSPAGGTFTSVQAVTLSSATSGATIYYTTDGSTPTANSTKYSTAITVGATETLCAIGVKAGMVTSATASAVYTFDTVATPTFSVKAGSYANTQMVTLSSATVGAAIYYTTDGSTPTEKSTKYSSAITVGETETLKTIAVKANMVASPVASATYTLSVMLDSRDGSIYKVVTIGKQTWMAQNLNYRNTTSRSDTVGVCYNYSADSCSKYGRLYTWAEVMGASSMYNSTLLSANLPHQGLCPNNWHVPSDVEWVVLIHYVGDSARVKLSSTTYCNGTDAHGFDALPAGNISVDGIPSVLGYDADFWTSSENNATDGVYRYFKYNSVSVAPIGTPKNYSLSLRCLHN